MAPKVPGTEEATKKGFSWLLRNVPKAVPKGVKNFLGINEKKADDVASTWASKRRLKNPELTTAQSRNPLISPTVGRYTWPRVIGAAGAGYGGYNAYNSMANGADTADTGQYTDYLNSLNQQAAEQRLREAFNPTTNYDTLAGYLSGMQSNGGYSAGGVSGGGLGSASGAYTTDIPQTAGEYYNTSSGDVAAGQGYQSGVAGIVDKYTKGLPGVGASNSASKAQNARVSDMIKGALSIAAIADKQGADKDYREFLLNQVKQSGNPYIQEFTGTEKGLAEVYDMWKNLSPMQIEEYSRNRNIHSPYDLYTFLKTQDPNTYGG